MTGPEVTFQPTGTRLDTILASVAARATARRAIAPLAAVEAEARALAAVEGTARRARFNAALRRPTLAVIAEAKRRSPSRGLLAEEPDLAARAHKYAAGGAAAMSVLTEQDHFHGRPEDLSVARACGLPLLRKDFILDEGMLLESVALGADAVLLIVLCHAPARLRELCALAHDVGLGVLVEAHDERELETALDCGADAVGVNARDLRTFHVDLAVVERLLPRVPAGVARVAESGIAGLVELLRIRDAGADAALVGEALMRSACPDEVLRGWSRALEDVR